MRGRALAAVAIGGLLGSLLPVAMGGAAVGARAPSRGGCRWTGAAAIGALVGVQFVSASIGWVVADDRILATSDGGERWQVQERSNTAQWGSLDFVDARHGWVVGTNELLTTADGGRHWRALAEPCPAIGLVDFVSPQVGFAVAGQNSLPRNQTAWDPGTTVLESQDGGRSWHRVQSPKDPHSVCFDSPERGWLGADGSIYSTTDGGRGWTRAVNGSPGGTAALACAPPQSVWAEIIGPGAALGNQPHIAYHGDEGAWKPIFAEQYFPHRGVSVSAGSPGPYAGPFSAISPAAAVFIDWCSPCAPDGTAPMRIAQAGGTRLSRVVNLGGLTSASAASFISTSQGWVTGELQHFTAKTTTWTYRIEQTNDAGRTWQTEYNSATHHA